MSSPSESGRPTSGKQRGVSGAVCDTATPPTPAGAADPIAETEAFSTDGRVAARSPAEQEVPQRFGRYEERRILTQGGFGAGYVGHDTQLDRAVAIKVPRHAASEQQVEEFLREARRAAQLRHPGIVTVYDVGVADGQCYIVSDFLHGTTLRQWLAAHTLTWQEAARITADVADALAHAHSHSTVHRDVKPENIILIEGLRPVLVDFGLGISESDEPGAQRGTVSGTLPYMSPEQFRGLAHRIAGRTDIYSLGVILYELLCGRLPFRSRDAQELCRQVLEDDPQPPRQLVPSLPRQLESICLKALAKEHTQRYTTAADMAEELRQVLASPALEGSAAFRAPAGPLPSSRRADSLPTLDVPSSARRAREAARRQVTVLYCKFEIDGPDGSVLELDLESQNELIQQFRDLCAQVAQQFAGTPAPTAAEDLLVCFGYPVAQEDAALRAVRMGMVLLRELGRWNPNWRQQHRAQVAAWVAIHTGLAVVSESTSSSSAGSVISLVGEAPTVATRLENAAAQAGGVVVSQATQRLVQGFFQCEPMGSLAVKGVAEPVEIFRVVGETQAHSRIEVAQQAGLTPLVGRDLEVSLLQKHWADASEGQGQVVLLSGDAGLGKSRLVYELKEHVQQTAEEAVPLVVEWRCSPYYQNTGLYPVTEHFQNVLEFGRDEGVDARLDKLERYFQRRHADKLGEIIPLFAALLSIPSSSRYLPLNLSPAGQKQRTLDALVNWLGELAEAQPGLFIVEDLHWSDPSTLELLELLINQVAGQRLLALFTFRPEFTVPWSARTHQTHLTLSRLRKQQVAEMMQRQTGSRRLPPAIVEQMAERTGGVPLFVEEYTKMLLESGGLKMADGQLELTSSFSSAKIPATLQDLLAARLDRLTSIHDVVQLGAALGREFSYELMRAVAGFEETQLQDELAKLVGGEILFQRGRPPQSYYQFKHALLQEAAYQSMLKKQRQGFHQRIAEVLQTQSPETVERHPELLAHHWTEAGQAATAVPYWLQAGQRSQMRSANREAIEQFQRGLQLLSTLPPAPQRDQQELDFLVPLGVVLMAAKGYSAPEVGDCFGRARQLCEALRATVRLFFVLRGMWVWRLLRDELDQCCELCDETLRLAETAEGRDLLTEAHFLPGNTYYYRGDFIKSMQHLEAGWAQFDLERSRQYSLRTGLNCGVTILCHMALALWQLGYPDQAFQRLQQALALADQVAHPFSQAFALYHRRRIAQYCRLDEEVEKCVEAELALAREQGFVFREAQALMCRAACQLRHGKPQEALRDLQQGEDTYQATGAKLSLTHHFCYLAETYLDLGQPAQAQVQLDKAVAVQTHSTERYLEAELLRLRGELLLARTPEAPEAEACFQRAMQIARRQQAKSRELRIALSWGRLKQQQGLTSNSLAILAPIYNWFTEGFGTPDLIEAKRLLDRIRTV